MFQRYGPYRLQGIFHQASFLPISTAPTMADSNSTDASSKGSKNSLNNTFPRFSTSHISGTGLTAPSNKATVFIAPTRTSSRTPPDLTPANLISTSFCGSVSAFSLSSIRSQRQSTLRSQEPTSELQSLM